MKQAVFFKSLLLLFLVTGFFVSTKSIRAANPIITIRNDGVVQKDGQAFYPFGFYHVSDVKNRYGAGMAEDVKKMGEAGFNILQLVITGPDAEKSTQDARAEAQKYGMTIIASYYKPSLDKWTRVFKDEPTLIGWNVLDDFNVPYSNPRINPDQAKQEADVVRNSAKANGATQIIYGSGGGYPFKSGQSAKYLFGEYHEAMDIMGTQTYPIGNNDESFANAPLEENFAYLKYAREQAPANKAVFANLQAFAWGGERYPNPVETRNMTWAAVVTRLEGILAYSYWEESGDLSTKTELWTEWKKLRQDINGELVEAILNGEYTYQDTTPGVFGKPRLHVATFVHGDKAFIIVLNTNSQSDLETKNQIKLPSDFDMSTFKPLFAEDDRYGKSLVLEKVGNDNYLSGVVAKSGVQVFTLEKSSNVVNATPSVTPSATPSTTPAPACRADFNQDGKVNLADYTILVSELLAGSANNNQKVSDLNDDGQVNIVDYTLFVVEFKNQCGQ